MRKNWLSFIVACCVLFFANIAYAEVCKFCNGDAICDTCNGLGYQTMIAYESDELVRVKCTAKCNDGYCPECYVSCEICKSDGLCDVCSGLGYLTMKVYGTDEDILVVCTGDFCVNGVCSACQMIDSELRDEAAQSIMMTRSGINNALQQMANDYAVKQERKASGEYSSLIGPELEEKDNKVRGHVVLTVSGRQYGDPVPMDREKIITLQQEDGKVNKVHITPEKVYMESSTCENQDCIGQGEVHVDTYKKRILSTYIICLPNNVQIEMVPME